MWLSDEDKRVIAIGSTIILGILSVFTIIAILFGTNIPQRLIGNQYVTENNYPLSMIVVIDTKTDKRACYRRFSDQNDFQLVTCPTDEKPNNSISLTK